jgi:hypothetical protein
MNIFFFEKIINNFKLVEKNSKNSTKSNNTNLLLVNNENELFIEYISIANILIDPISKLLLRNK